MKPSAVVHLFLTCAVLTLAGCEANPVSGRQQFVFVSEEQAQSSAAQAYAQTLQQAQQKGKLDDNSAQTQRVQRVTQRLIAQAQRMYPPSAGWQWQMAVIDTPELNAWVMPGGKMAMYTGLLDKLKLSDDEIAQVMGHEIAHAILGHGRERMSRALATDLSLQLGSVLAGQDLSGLAPLAQVGVLLPNSRASESEADRYGLEMAARAGYDPQAAITLWQKMARANTSSTPQFLSTHPSPENRLQALAALVPQFTPVYQAARAGR